MGIRRFVAEGGRNSLGLNGVTGAAIVISDSFKAGHPRASVSERCDQGRSVPEMIIRLASLRAHSDMVLNYAARPGDNPDVGVMIRLCGEISETTEFP
jgi:hypothetical protein